MHGIWRHKVNGGTVNGGTNVIIYNNIFSFSYRLIVTFCNIENVGSILW